jgi:hypothetical protein
MTEYVCGCHGRLVRPCDAFTGGPAARGTQSRAPPWYNQGWPVVATAEKAVGLVRVLCSPPAPTPTNRPAENKIMTDDPADDGFYPTAFLIVYPVWLIAPVPLPTDLPRLIQRLIQGVSVGVSGTTNYVPVFTDRDLAERFGNQLEGAGGEDAEVSLMSVPDGAYFKKLLGLLLTAGRTHVSFDPEEHGDNPVLITRVLAALRGG